LLKPAWVSERLRLVSVWATVLGLPAGRALRYASQSRFQLLSWSRFSSLSNAQSWDPLIWVVTGCNSLFQTVSEIFSRSHLVFASKGVCGLLRLLRPAYVALRIFSRACCTVRPSIEVACRFTAFAVNFSSVAIIGGVFDSFSRIRV
jgi:hypothetical protein